MKILENTDLWLLEYTSAPFNQMKHTKCTPQSLLHNTCFVLLCSWDFAFLLMSAPELFLLSDKNSVFANCKQGIVGSPCHLKSLRWFSTTVSHAVGNPKFSQGILKNYRSSISPLVTSDSNVQPLLILLCVLCLGPWLFPFPGGLPLLHSRPLHSNTNPSYSYKMAPEIDTCWGRRNYTMEIFSRQFAIRHFSFLFVNQFFNTCCQFEGLLGGSVG